MFRLFVCDREREQASEQEKEKKCTQEKENTCVFEVKKERKGKKYKK